MSENLKKFLLAKGLNEDEIKKLEAEPTDEFNYDEFLTQHEAGRKDFWTAKLKDEISGAARTENFTATLKTQANRLKKLYPDTADDEKIKAILESEDKPHIKLLNYQKELADAKLEAAREGGDEELKKELNTVKETLTAKTQELEEKEQEVEDFKASEKERTDTFIKEQKVKGIVRGIINQVREEIGVGKKLVPLIEEKLEAHLMSFEIDPESVTVEGKDRYKIQHNGTHALDIKGTSTLKYGVEAARDFIKFHEYDRKGTGTGEGEGDETGKKGIKKVQGKEVNYQAADAMAEMLEKQGISTKK